MRILVGCEFSGNVREALRARGHDAYSCDLLPSARPSPYHIQGDIRRELAKRWDALIAFPSCTYLCASGIHWNARRPERAALTDEAVAFVRELWAAPIEKVAIENPVGVLSTRFAKPTQIIQPWQFGEDASKATCLWLRNLPLLVATEIIDPSYACKCGARFEYALGKYGCPSCLGTAGAARPVWANQTASGQNKLGPSADRWMLRSVTYPGIAAAMAEQWT